ncbi:pentapeptide repeat-containing protein [Phytomonospora sp. NPDC050363]|uniref:pentapeptide repeat-containing protein n=1 Tax=Phytomonospora sp. NPDC050363 TaxID=3155642 RepID=UPI0033CEEFF0
MFTGDTRFGEAVFTGATGFSEAVFTGDAGFSEAVFTGDTEVDGLVFALGVNLEVEDSSGESGAEAGPAVVKADAAAGVA